jgi:type IX secretion system PorP/SprF family membrane protein
MYRKYIAQKTAVVVFVCLSLTTAAQDFHLSQYDAAPLNINPAMTGMYRGNLRIHGHYRTQWSSLASKPFQTGLISVDLPWKKISVGLQIANFRAGMGNYNVFSPMLSVAYDHKLDKKNFHHISIGVQGGGFQKSINMNKLYFETQFTPYGGGGFDQGLSNQESLANNALFIPDVNAGIMYYYGKENALINPFIGASLLHINQPKESFFSQQNRLPMHLIIHAGTKVNINEKIQLLPKFFWMGQKKAREITAAVHMHYYLKHEDAYLIFGPTYRLSGTLSKSKQIYPTESDAAIIEGGLALGRFVYRLSYDINTSTLRTFSNGRGALELSVTYINRKINPNPIKTCPRL